MTFVHTSHLEVNANSSQISLMDDDYIQYITVNEDAKDSTKAKRETGEPKVTPKKAKKDKAKGNAKDGGDSPSDDQDDGMFSDGKGQQPSNSTGFQGWSDDEVEGDELVAVANIVRHLEEDQQDSGVGMGGNRSKSNIVGIVPEGQVMVDMAAHNKATGSGATMDCLRHLGDDIIELSRQLNHKMELATLALFDKVKAGFSGTGGVARQFVGDMSKLATNFFMDARVYEAQLDSANSEAFHSAVLGLQEKVDALLRQAAALEETYKHSKVLFDNILATMRQEIHNFANQASHCLCNEYKRHSFDRIAQDHPHMDVMPFVSNVIQNVCTFDTLLTSHQLGWSVVPLQILMVPILTEAAAMPCHLEFVQYLTDWSLHVQRSIQVSNTTPAPCLAGINLKSEQENPSSSRPKTSDPDSPETHPTPRSNPPVMLSKPPEMPTKPETTPSKTPGATPMKPKATPLKTSDASLRPPAMPKKCALMPQKAIPGGSSNSAKDILDRVTAKYGSGISSQYSNMLALLTSGKSSQVVAPKCMDPDTPAGGDRTYVKPTRSDSDSDRKKVEPPNKKAKRDPGSRPEVADARSRGSKKTAKKMPKSKKTITSDSDSSESENMCGKLHSQPTKEEIEKCQCQHTDKWASDLPSIQSYRQWKGIIPENPPPHDYKDHSDYIQQVLRNNKSTGLSIHHISDLLKQYSKNHSSTRRKRYEAVKTLSGATMGKSRASPLFVVEVFQVPVTKELITPDNVNGYYSQIMMGLCNLFAHDTICKITTSDTGNEKNTVSECYCPLCIYLVGKHMTMNNHICYHLQLALVCRIKHCFHIETQAEGMWNHIKEKHNVP